MVPIHEFFPALFARLGLMRRVQAPLAFARNPRFVLPPRKPVSEAAPQPPREAPPQPWAAGSESSATAQATAYEGSPVTVSYTHLKLPTKA